MAKEKDFDCAIEKEDLLRCLYLVQGVVEKRSSLPILSHVLIEGSEETISLGATDLEIGIRQQCKAMVKKSGAVTTDARKLYEIVRELPPERLMLRSSGEGWVEVSSGRSRFRMASFDPKEFPAISPTSGTGEKKVAVSATLSGKILSEMIEKTLFAAAADESRQNLSGVYLEALPNGKLRMVSSDGHRLAIIERDAGIAEADTWPHAILPRKGLIEARKLLEKDDEGETDLTLHGTTAMLKKGTTELSMRLVEGDFPDYQQVLPKEKRNPITFPREEFLSAIRRLLVLTTERARGVKLQVENNRMTVSVNTPDLGEGVEEIEVENSGKDLTIGFNGRYLTEVLNVLDEGVKIHLFLRDEVSPGLLQAQEDQDFSYVIMPMRIF